MLKELLRKMIALLTVAIVFTTSSLTATAQENKYCYIADEYIQICDEMQEKYNVSSCLLIALIECESSGRPDAISCMGAKGLMQVMEVNNPKHLDLYDPRTNIELGTQVLLRYAEKSNGDLLLAISYYNGQGETAYRKWFGGQYGDLEYANKVCDLAMRIEVERYETAYETNP